MVFEDIACKSDDEKYMLEAMMEAADAAGTGEVPVGAVIVMDGAIIARAHNLVETELRSSAHAEMLAIEQAERALGYKWLTGATMYVTLEPCSMCAGAMVLARIGRLVYGASDPKNGACGSAVNVAANQNLTHRMEIEGGVLGAECSAQLTEFFREMRRARK